MSSVIQPSLRGFPCNGQFETIPVILANRIEVISTMKDISVLPIDQQFTINHDQQTSSISQTLWLYHLYPNTLELCHVRIHQANNGL